MRLVVVGADNCCYVQLLCAHPGHEADGKYEHDGTNSPMQCRLANKSKKRNQTTCSTVKHNAVSMEV